MDEVKGMLQSKAIWGALIAVAATVAQLAGWDIGGDTEGLANEIVTIVGGLIAIWGRATAVKRIAGVASK